jgi:hypothetical protein
MIRLRHNQEDAPTNRALSKVQKLGARLRRAGIAALATTLLAPTPVQASSFFFTEEELSTASEATLTAQRNLVQQVLAAAPRDRDYVMIDDMRFQRDALESIQAFIGAKWTDGIVYYGFTSDVTTENRQRWIAAAQEWAKVANLEFRPYTGKETYFIGVENSYGNWSEVGMQTASADTITNMGIYSWGWKFIIAHEIGHALGLHHEQTRYDRDKYVTIWWDDIKPGMEYNFAKQSSAVTYTPYDFYSVMHYSNDAFSTNGNYTITPKPEWEQYLHAMGNRNYLSTLDKEGMAKRYKSSVTPPPPPPPPLPPPPPPPPPPVCDEALTIQPYHTFEEVFPRDVGANPDSVIAANEPIAVRINAHSDVVGDSVWMYVEGDKGYAASGGKWRPTVPGDYPDGWAIFSPPTPFNHGERIRVTAGARLADGTEFGPLSFVFQVSADVEYETEPPYLRELGAVQPMKKTLATPISSAYQAGPQGVFDNGFSIQIPLPDGYNVGDVEIYYLSTSERHPHWYPFSGVEGLEVPESRKIIKVDGTEYIEVQINHSAILQLGVPAESNVASFGLIPIGAGGDLGTWLMYLLTIGAAIALLARRSSRPLANN